MKTNIKTLPPRWRRAARQKGVVLWITLMILVVLLGATLVIARNTALGQNIAGNLGFKKNTTQAGDYGTEQARAWLMQHIKADLLFSDKPADAYWASWRVLSDDPNEFDWSQAKSAGTSTDHAVDYVIHRMCRFPGRTSGEIMGAPAGGDPAPLGTQECVFVPDGDGDGTIDGASAQLGSKAKRPFYRVTSRIKGPRKTVSYVQSMLY